MLTSDDKIVSQLKPLEQKKWKQGDVLGKAKEYANAKLDRIETNASNVKTIKEWLALLPASVKENTEKWLIEYGIDDFDDGLDDIVAMEKDDLVRWLAFMDDKAKKIVRKQVYATLKGLDCRIHLVVVQRNLDSAVSDGNVEDVRILLSEEGIDVNAKDQYGRTPLWVSSEEGKTDVVELLLAHDKIDVNAKNNDGQTPLWKASEYGKTDVVELLLAHDEIDVNATNNDGDTPLYVADNEEIKELLKAKGGKMGLPPLLDASFLGDVENVRVLLSEEGIDVNAADSHGKTPLHYAVCYEHADIVKLLLARDEIKVNAKTNWGGTPLQQASTGKTDVVELLLARDEIDVNAADNDGYTPLFQASNWGKTDVVELLLDREEIEVNAKNSDGFTPLHGALLEGHIDVVKLLLAHDKIDVNAADSHGMTPLYRASSLVHTEIVKLLLAHDKIDINAADKYGQTPLYCGNIDIIKLLLAHDEIDVNAKDNDGKTPLYYYTSNEYERYNSEADTEEIEELLKAKGAVDDDDY
eukprot:g7839.t1